MLAWGAAATASAGAEMGSSSRAPVPQPSGASAVKGAAGGAPPPGGGALAAAARRMGAIWPARSSSRGSCCFVIRDISYTSSAACNVRPAASDWPALYPNPLASPTHSQLGGLRISRPKLEAPHAASMTKHRQPAVARRFGLKDHVQLRRPAGGCLLPGRRSAQLLVDARRRQPRVHQKQPRDGPRLEPVLLHAGPQQLQGQLRAAAMSEQRHVGRAGQQLLERARRRLAQALCERRRCSLSVECRRCGRRVRTKRGQVQHDQHRWRTVGWRRPVAGPDEQLLSTADEPGQGMRCAPAYSGAVLGQVQQHAEPAPRKDRELGRRIPRG
eukprot:scaffold24896_cov110-Isochrysis_galbana.AAC.3